MLLTRNTLASKSKSVPDVARSSQPKPIKSLLRFGSVLVSDKLPPLLNDNAMILFLLLNDYEINSEDDIEDIISNSYDSEFLFDAMEPLCNTEVFHNDKLIWKNGNKVE